MLIKWNDIDMLWFQKDWISEIKLQNRYEAAFVQDSQCCIYHGDISPLHAEREISPHSHPGAHIPGESWWNEAEDRV